MLSDDERKLIVDKVTERMLLLLPDIIGNLIMTNSALIRVNKHFYEKYKDLTTQKDLVASVVEQIESDHPGLEYEKVLDLALPIIKDRSKTISKLNTSSVSKPSRDLRSLDLGNNGEL